MEYPTDIKRPQTRADCQGHREPCPWVSCRYHLYLDISAYGGLKINQPSKHPWEIKESCALDVADRGEHTLEYISELFSVCRERIRQEESVAKSKLDGRLDEWRRYVGMYRNVDAWWLEREGFYETVYSTPIRLVRKAGG